MKYFFVIDDSRKRHVIVAHDIEEAKSIAEASIKIKTVYELTPDNFTTAGFLISDK